MDETPPLFPDVPLSQRERTIVNFVEQGFAGTRFQLVPNPSSNLTLRERQALELITEGLTNRQIGERLGIAEKTVKNYLSGLLARLGIEPRQLASIWAPPHRYALPGWFRGGC